jgi:hypothetical protein
MPELIVTSIAEWLALPEPTLPVIKSAKEKGSVYHLYKVGFFLVPEDQLSQTPAKAQMFGGKKILPTGVIDFEGKKVLCRLPLELSEWVSFCVSAAHGGQNVFPCDVEFGRLDGRAYAEVL